MNLIEIKQLNKVYKNKSIEVKAINNVNLAIEKGDFVSIIGPSGSGKSTLLYMIGGLEQPTSGDIIVNNQNITNLKEEELADYRRTKIGFVFQQFNLLSILNVKENIILPLRMEKEKVDSNYLEKLLDILNLKDYLNHLPSELSGGQQQRVALARALITRPDIILADEPTGNLDQKSSLDVMNLLETCNRELGQTVILITHNESLAARANTQYKIVDGCIYNEKG